MWMMFLASPETSSMYRMPQLRTAFYVTFEMFVNSIMNPSHEESKDDEANDLHYYSPSF
jgi:hypothetical protein